MNPFGQHHRQIRLHSRREATAGFPDVALVHLIARHSPIDVVGPDAVYVARSQSFPQPSHRGFIAKRNVDLPNIVRQGQIMMAGFAVDLNAFGSGLEDLVDGFLRRCMHDVEGAAGDPGVVSISPHMSRFTKMG